MKIRSLLFVGVLGSFAIACSVSGQPVDQFKEQGASSQQSTTGKPETSKDATEAKSTPKPGEETKTAPKKDGTKATPKKDAGAAGDDDDDGAGQNGQDGQGGTVVGDATCCRNGEFFDCPDAKSCLGGVDLDACFAKCEDLPIAQLGKCMSACGDQASNAPPPVNCKKGTPPPNVSCK